MLKVSEDFHPAKFSTEMLIKTAANPVPEANTKKAGYMRENLDCPSKNENLERSTSKVLVRVSHMSVYLFQANQHSINRKNLYPSLMAQIVL